jgi:hypothetical protein
LFAACEAAPVAAALVAIAEISNANAAKLAPAAQITTRKVLLKSNP